MGEYLYVAMSNVVSELLLGSSRLSGQLGYLFLEEITYRKLQKPHKTILYSTM